MQWWQMIILAVVQGITEFLPISSDGHLVVVEHLIGMHTDMTEINVLLHAGTLGSILVVYHRSILKLLTADRRVFGLLAVGTIPVILVGVPLALFGKWIIELPILAGLFLPVTGLMLLWIAGRDGEEDYSQLSYKQAFFIGAFQSLALLPGISRSGSTIVAALIVGLKRPEAATFSFLLAIPAIAMATGWETLQLIIGRETPQTSVGMMVGGAMVAFVVGIAALLLLLRLLNRGKLHYFAFWCIPFGIAVFVWQCAALLK
jgi:undecaprenyl-diphosphatase